MSGVIAFLIRLGFGGIVDKALMLLEQKAEHERDAERLRTLATVEIAREAVKEAQTLAALNRAKFSFPVFWAFLAVSLAPSLFWAGAVTIYSVFWCADCAFAQPWTIAALPPQLADLFSRQMEWLFYVGSGVAAWHGVRAIR
ncbi:hypothetical protein [Pukyongiella litopenaei]|uniref:Uncharacterized protein n=1 Tax=Pukyongiella litopenaei TaxID=2605946 RepID=A0A2S0MNR1_9RHOB|nr:hypothetical protein [Pukyongiella litopenaei]AVO37381.1 hypothetical protein C6Y53_06435 [Pukyongiella litopenaei]